MRIEGSGHTESQRMAAETFLYPPADMGTPVRLFKITHTNGDDFFVTMNLTRHEASWLILALSELLAEAV